MDFIAVQRILNPIVLYANFGSAYSFMLVIFLCRALDRRSYLSHDIVPARDICSFR